MSKSVQLPGLTVLFGEKLAGLGVPDDLFFLSVPLDSLLHLERSSSSLRKSL